MLFVSFVGTQSMSVWNPLLALNEIPKKAYLFYTETSEKFVRRLQIPMMSRSIVNVETIRLPHAGEDASPAESRDVSGKTLNAFRRVLDEAVDERIAFNIAGGMNFQVAACMGGITDEQRSRIDILYPERACIHRVRINGGCVSHDTLDLPDPVKFFKIQGLTYDRPQGDAAIRPAHGMLRKLFEKSGVPLPFKFTAVRIGGVLFHAFWNRGNALVLFRLMDARLMSETGQDPLAEISALIDFAKNRDASADIYTKQIALLTNNTNIVEHAKTAMGKIDVFHYGPGGEADDVRDQRLKAFLGAGMAEEPAESPGASCVEYPANGVYKASSALVTALGPNATPTLTAIVSHTPEHAVILYTSGNAEVERYVDGIKNHGANLPVRKLTFQPIDFLGLNILNLARPEEERIECNITPGTKAQGVFLTLWAIAQKADAYSIYTDGNCLAPLSGQASSMPLDSPSPLELLQLTGFMLRSRGEEMRASNRKNHFEDMLGFLREAIRENVDLSEFPQKKVTVGNNKFGKQNGKYHLQYLGRQWNMNLKGGYWVQELAAIALEECGAEGVRNGVQIAFSKETEAFLAGKHDLKPHERPHLADLDVVAKLRANQYLVECKSYDVLSGKNSASLEKIETRVKAQASLMGRFAVPLIFSMHYGGEPIKKNPQGVYVFGLKTLCDKDVLRNFLERCVKEQRKKL